MSISKANSVISLPRVKFSLAEKANIDIYRKRTTLSSIKKVRIIANKPVGNNTSDISDSIGIECDVVEEVIVDHKTMEKELIILLHGSELTLYPGEYEIVEGLSSF
jgi:hypothetical protein